MDATARIGGLARRVADDLQLEVLHVEFWPERSPALVRIYIDKPGGVNLDDCKNVSRQLGVLLEVEDFIRQRYTLEVSSPGIERPLFKSEDYQKFQGREIRLHAHSNIDGRRKFTGVIESFEDGMLRLECEGHRFDIPYSQIKKANLVHKFQ